MLIKRIKQIVGNSALGPTLRFWYQRIRPPKDQWSLRIYRDQQRLERILPQVIGRDSNCLDIGAHQGGFLSKILELAPEGKHWAFEPLPHLCEEIKEQFPMVEVREIALSDFNGSTHFHWVKDAPAWSGLKPQELPEKSTVEKIRVEVRQLDDILPTEYQPHFIKLDVEGAELQTLQGARATIKKFQPVVMFEHAAIHNFHYGTKPEDIYHFF